MRGRIDKVIHKDIFKNKRITLSPCFAFIPKAGFSLNSDPLEIESSSELLVFHPMV